MVAIFKSAVGTVKDTADKVVKTVKDVAPALVVWLLALVGLIK